MITSGPLPVNAASWETEDQYQLSLEQKTSKALDLTGISIFHSQGIKGKGHLMAILDVGLDVSLESFIGRVYEGVCILGAGDEFPDTNKSTCPNGTSFQVGLDAIQEPQGHGNLVTGVAVGNQVGGFSGVAPEAKVLFIKTGSSATSMKAALQFILDWNSDPNNPQVESVSISFGGFSDKAPSLQTYCGQDEYFSSSILAGKLLEGGTPVFIAAGNNGWNDAEVSPACHEDFFSVAAVAAINDLGEGAVYSNASPKTWTAAPDYVTTIAMQGEEFATGGGTSAAAPFAAAAFLLLKEKLPDESTKNLLLRMRNTGQEILYRSLAGIRMLNVVEASTYSLVSGPLYPNDNVSYVSGRLEIDGQDYALYAAQQLIKISQKDWMDNLSAIMTEFDGLPCPTNFADSELETKLGTKYFKILKESCNQSNSTPFFSSIGLLMLGLILGSVSHRVLTKTKRTPPDSKQEA